MDGLEPTWFLGLEFRSPSHMYWFQGSLTIALVSLAVVLASRARRPSAELIVLYLACWTVALLFHLGASVSAVINALEKTGFKLLQKCRKGALAKVPVMLVVGKREAEERKVSIRRLGSQEQQVLGLTEAIAALTREAVPPDLAR